MTTSTKRHRSGRRAAAGLIALTLSALGAACSSSSGNGSLGKDPLGTAIAATEKAGSGRIKGTTQRAKVATTGTVDGTWSGDLKGEGATKVVFISQKARRVPTELRWTDGVLYINRAVVPVEAAESVAIFTRVAKFKPWRKLTLQGGVVNVVAAAFSPLAVLQRLQSVKQAPTVHRGEQVGSVKATRLTSSAPLLIGIWPAATVDVWVDGSNRVVRVRIANPDGGMQYDVTDYGTKVDVTAPPATEITGASELTKIQAIEAFRTAASGRNTGVTWALQRARGTQDTTCWRWQATPSLGQQLKQPAEGRCLRPIDADAGPDDQVQFLVYGNGFGTYDALAVQLPSGVKKLVLGFAGGKTQTIPVTNPLVWVGPSSPLPAYLGVTMNDGTAVDCGAGAVTTKDDLTNTEFTQAAATAAWACLPHEGS
jgi:hypothetical protein